MPSSFWKMLKSLYAVDTLQGYTEEEIESLKELFGGLPQVLEEYYRTAARTEVFHQVQDSWMRPKDFRKWEWLQKSDHLVVIMDCGDGDSDMLYGATSETAYKKLMAVLEGIGEPL